MFKYIYILDIIVYSVFKRQLKKKENKMPEMPIK